jgi:hypothetical protein
MSYDVSALGFGIPASLAAQFWSERFLEQALSIELLVVLRAFTSRDVGLELLSKVQL